MKVVLVLVAVIFCCSATRGAAVQPSVRNWEDRFDSVIQKAQAEVDKIKSWIADQSSKLQAKATAEISKVYQSVENAVSSAQQQGATLGIDVSSCVSGEQSQVDAKVQQLVQASFQCVTGQLDSALDLANHLLSQAEDAKEKVADFQDKFKDCGKKHKFQKEKCIAEETAKALEEVAVVETQVTSFISRETALLEELPAKLLACEGQQVAAAESDAKHMSADLATCLAALGISS